MYKYYHEILLDPVSTIFKQVGFLLTFIFTATRTLQMFIPSHMGTDTF